MPMKLFCLITTTLLFCSCQTDSRYFGKIFIPAAPYANYETGYIYWTTNSAYWRGWYGDYNHIYCGK